MNAYFLFHAIETANTQLVKAGIDPDKFQKQEIVNLAMQLAIIDQLQTISGDIRDVESKLTTLEIISDKMGSSLSWPRVSPF